MPAGMRRALTVGVPALGVAALAVGAAVEVAFLLSPAAGYCPEYGGILSYCFFPPSEIATLTIGVALGLTGAGVASLVHAWREHYGAAGALVLPALLGVVLVLIAAARQGSPPAEPLLNSPPPGYGLFETGGYAVLVGVVLLGTACCFQLAVWLRDSRSPDQASQLPD